ncbi:MAG: hypothetical protein ACPLN0_00695 [Candidatus Hydrothermia bacterium]
MFNLGEILNIAMAIEESGIKFYKSAVRKYPEFLDVFSFLEKEEMKHLNEFRDLLNSVQDYTLNKELYPEDYFSYLNAIGKNVVFKDEMLEQELQRLSSPQDVIRFAMDMEMKSINYYTFLKDLLKPEYTKGISLIIAEERKHYIKLAEILDRLEK